MPVQALRFRRRYPINGRAVGTRACRICKHRVCRRSGDGSSNKRRLSGLPITGDPEGGVRGRFQAAPGLQSRLQ